MKKLLSLLLVLSLILAGISLCACGNGDEAGETQTPATSEPTGTPEKELSAGGLNWNDMPVYSGTKQAQKGSWSVPPTEGDYSKVEWRYYESGDDVDTIANFYKTQMPARDWEEVAWMDVQDMKWGMYYKNNENDAAMVWVASEEGNSIIAMMRAAK